MAHAQYTTSEALDQQYEVLDNASKHSADENHTYAVIPANHSKATKKAANSSATQRRSVLNDIPATPPPIPSRGSLRDARSQEQSSTLVCETRNPQRQNSLVGIPQKPSVVQGEASPEEPQEHIYHILEQGQSKSSSPDDSDNTYHLLEEGGLKDPGEHMLGRVSWSGPESEEGGMASLGCSEEWEERAPTSYEVPVKLLTAKDKGT